MKLSKYFSTHELACSCCGLTALEAHAMSEQEFQQHLTRLDTLREMCGFPLIGSSGYRCVKHNKEVGGGIASQHLTGSAQDFQVYGDRAYKLLQVAMNNGWNGIGVYQADANLSSRFIHIDRRASLALWSH